MALATRRSYAGAAPACTLSSDIAAGATSFSITGTTTNWPATATGPFYMVIDPGLSTEEKVLVAGRTGGSLSSVTRGVDGTTAASHVTGATCYPVFTAVDANDANLLASRLSAKGDLISSDGSDPTKVAVGSNNTRLVADSAQTSGMKWVADTQNTVVDAKGDLLVGSAADTVARLAVGSDGHVLVADSTATNGLSYGPLNGWRNAIINGDFSVWQRGAGSWTANGDYTADRWQMSFSGTGTALTTSRQSFTAGNAISGQEPIYHIRCAATGGSGNSSLVVLTQKVEGVRTFAGQTATVSFWAKASSGTPGIGLDLYQDFGSGGSATVSNGGQKFTLSTSWQRFSATISLASISGKTIGTNDLLGVRFWFSSGSDYNSLNGSLGIQTATVDLWGVQVEAGSVATPFERRPQQVELALCQRYYWRTIKNGSNFSALCTAAAYNTVTAYGTYRFHVPMRRVPDIAFSSTTADHRIYINGASKGASAVGTNLVSADSVELYNSPSGGITAGHAGWLFLENSAWVEGSAEL